MASADIQENYRPAATPADNPFFRVDQIRMGEPTEQSVLPKSDLSVAHLTSRAVAAVTAPATPSITPACQKTRLPERRVIERITNPIWRHTSPRSKRSARLRSWSVSDSSFLASASISSVCLSYLSASARLASRAFASLA